MDITPFELEAELTAEDVRVIKIRGELDLETTGSLERELDKLEGAAPRALVIDLSECEFIDSTGIALLVKTWKSLDGGRENGSCRVALCGPAVQVRRVIEITGLTDTIPVYADRAEATSKVTAG